MVKRSGRPPVRLLPTLALVLSFVQFQTVPTRAKKINDQETPGATPVTGAHTVDEAPVGWPHVRGSHFDGHSTESHLADSWPEQGPPVLWTRELGQGYSALVAWNDRIATQYQTLGGQYVVCLDADTGRTLWEHRYDWPYEPAGVYPGPRATPTYWQGRLYFAGPRGTVGCLNAANGQLLWRVNVIEQFGSSGTDFGYTCSPTVIEGMVILPIGGVGASLVALNADDGEVVWRAGDDAASYTPAYPISLRGQRLVLGYLQNALVCHDLITGRLIWRRQLSSGYDEHAAWPIYREPHLWISSAFQGGSELLELTGNRDQPLWKSDLMSNDIFSSVLADDALYGFDLREAQAKTHRPSRGQFRCIDFLSGRENWSIGSLKLRRKLEPSTEDRCWGRWRARLVGLMFILCCAGYFLLCRRLSLVFEWVFLCGFAAALPFALAASHCFQERRWRFAWLSLMTATAFASFYWSAVSVLRLKG